MKRTVFLASALFALTAAVFALGNKEDATQDTPANTPANTPATKTRAPWAYDPQQAQPTQQAQTTQSDQSSYVDPFSMRVFGVPSSKITAYYSIRSASDWERACNDIKNGKPNTTYLFIIEEDVGIPGSTDYSFNGVFQVVTNSATGISWNEYYYIPVTIGITGKGKLYLTSDGYLLNINGQTLIIDGEVTLEGRKTNPNPLIFVKNEYSVNAVTKLELRNGTLRGNGHSAVRIHSGEFTMSGGAITGNSSLNGGGVCVMGNPDEVRFTMSGGTISGNTAVYDKSAEGKGGYGSDGKTGSGGGIYFQGGRISITGGTISGNKAVRGGAIFIYGSGALINKSGGVIYGNDAKASERNTASGGDTWGHGILFEEWFAGFPTYFMGNYYRNATLGEADTIRTDFRSHSPDLLPTAGGQTKNGWTKQ
jgi:hypothetical protein